MISRLTLSRDFGELGSYLEFGRHHVDPAERVAWMKFRNLPTERMDVAVRLMGAAASISRRTQQPVLHLSISFAPGDPVDEELMWRVMLTTMADLDLEEHQAVIVAHLDTVHPHVHAMINRVHPETRRAWRGSWSMLRAEASLRRQEQELGLRVVPGWLAPVPGEPGLKPKPRLARGTGDFLREVQERAVPVLERAQSWSEVERGLADFGLSVRVNGRGMSVTDGRQEVKASEIGRGFSRFHLEKRFGRYSDYRLRVEVANRTVRGDKIESAVERGTEALLPAYQEPEAPSAAPAPSTDGEPLTATQLSLVLPEPPAAAGPPRAAEPLGTQQLTFALEPAVTPAPRQPLTRIDSASTGRDVVGPEPEPAVQPPLVPERPVTSPWRRIPPELRRISELIQEVKAWHRTLEAAYDARSAIDPIAADLKRLEGLERTALDDEQRLRLALRNVYLDPWEAITELTRFGLKNSLAATKYALTETPEKFSRLRGPRVWYTWGPGRKHVESVFIPLENALRSAPDRPTKPELEAARAHLREAVENHRSAREAHDAFRGPTLCEREAADLLRPVLRELSAEEIAELLATLLPPEDREGAKLVERIINLAISLNYMLSRSSPRRGRE